MYKYTFFLEMALILMNWLTIVLALKNTTPRKIVKDVLSYTQKHITTQLPHSNLLGRGQKRKIDSECRVFDDKWWSDYLVNYSDNRIICLVCKECISILKGYNIRRHYEIKHLTNFSKFTGKLRLDKL